MILEAFASYLKLSEAQVPATSILARWLWERLSTKPETTVDRVLHHEISLTKAPHTCKNSLKFQPVKSADSECPTFVFEAQSESGQKLLNSLYHYAMSWDQQKFTRFVHNLKASDFKM